MRRFTPFLTICLITMESSAQQVQLLHEGSGISIRGLSVVKNDVVWVSGNKGTVGRSLDGGTSWQWMTVPGYENRDFRDVEAFDASTAVIMAVGEPAIILQTVDGGKRWKAVYTNDTPGMFLDAMEFWNGQSGIVLGDPVGGKFFVARTFDGGSNWRAIAPENAPAADSGEACFAASGTNVRALARDEACFISGGSKSRFFKRDKSNAMPIVQGSETAGANSIAVWYRGRSRSIVVAVGGDFAKDSSTENTACISFDEGENWELAASPPSGYRSCVEFITRKRLVTCGLNGVDVSEDQGRTWRRISDTGFHVCRKSSKGKVVFLAGSDGRIARLAW